MVFVLQVEALVLQPAKHQVGFSFLKDYVVWSCLSFAQKRKVSVISRAKFLVKINFKNGCE